MALDDAICPILRANLSAAAQTLARWNPGLGTPPGIEAPEKARTPRGDVASFLSSNRIRKVHVAATFDAANLAPWGSHPLLDPYYSSAHLQIGHHGLEMSRLTKTAIVAGWPVALHNLNVCVSKRSQGRNCGRCEKCIRTMLALLSLGRLAECQAFAQADLKADDLSRLVISYDYEASCYRESPSACGSRGAQTSRGSSTGRSPHTLIRSVAAWLRSCTSRVR